MLRFLLAGHCFLLWSCHPPASGGWREVASMNDVHESPGALVLSDGRVLVVGGHHVDATRRLVDTVELYDGAADKWTKTAAMLEKREGIGTLELLSDGRVLLPGEHNTLSGSELFDLATETWSATGSLNVGRGGHVSALLDDGRVLAVGGVSRPAGKALAEAEIFDPATETWSSAGRLAVPRWNHRVLRLGSGVLVVGGYNASGQLSSVEAIERL